MSEILEGDEWKHQPPDSTAAAPAPGHFILHSRAEQQAWLDDLYLRGQISLKVWRFQFDLLSLKNADGSLPPLE
ncbi:hypothetical protein CfE428DRAFT_4201 [Chthoniobacter flavus Ellin428]|uniref:Uncharacterized protein n=1 Tax=Chthoniobacter flavus Ellin428 TaxID=497964 RepID=B4D5L2_9BACT|nr:hypothetical protein [Chthoniobacter flavus]EDY18417.1 hypothetical protein CfE428DRAFT_4201 [Chthoniobacter flavus Ellin428]TCO90874.1 hypothetical protein EV701_10923 [Chthoniobacter flavus]